MLPKRDAVAQEFRSSGGAAARKTLVAFVLQCYYRRRPACWRSLGLELRAHVPQGLRAPGRRTGRCSTPSRQGWARFEGLP